MQRVLEKMAKQLNAYDEASLMQLWQHYAMQVSEFEPTKRWEEATVALCLIQAIRWKNQLFNYHLAATASPSSPGNDLDLPAFFLNKREKSAERKKETERKKKAVVLSFPGRDPGPAGTEKKDANAATRAAQPGRALKQVPNDAPEQSPGSDKK